MSFVEEPVGAGIGLVRVNESGRVYAIELDQQAVRTLNGRRLGELIAATVNRAEEHARRTAQDKSERRWA